LRAPRDRRRHAPGFRVSLQVGDPASARYRAHDRGAQLLANGAGQAGNADDFASGHGEPDVVQSVGVHLKGEPAGIRAVGTVAHLSGADVDVLADAEDEPYQVVLALLAKWTAAHQHAVAQHSAGDRNRSDPKREGNAIHKSLRGGRCCQWAHLSTAE
jgi:hypothetical protein